MKLYTGSVLGLLFAVILVAGCTAPEGGDTDGGGTTPASLDWCTAGESWGAELGYEYGNIQVIGAEMYQGQAACHVKYSYSSAEGSVVIDYYIYDEEANDFWAVMNLGPYGTSTFHVVNGECVGGDCAYWGY